MLYAFSVSILCTVSNRWWMWTQCRGKNQPIALFQRLLWHSSTCVNSDTSERVTFLCQTNLLTWLFTFAIIEYFLQCSRSQEKDTLIFREYSLLNIWTNDLFIILFKFSCNFFHPQKFYFGIDLVYWWLIFRESDW